jgi:hypothetical protein
MKICIVAAGLATRLQPLTNYIPKFLINIGKQTGFVELIRYWSEHSNDFTIIIHPKYEEITRAYFDLYFKNTNIKLTIKTCETALGTAHTIDTSLGNDYDGDDILFTWCDVIPSNKFDLDELERYAHADHRGGYAGCTGDGIAVFTVDNGLNRYKYQRNTLVKADGGDVIGIYYVERYDRLRMDYVEGQDFADVLSKNAVNQFPLKDIIDFGDKPKLFEVLKSSDGAREFNSVKIYETLVHKTPLNAHGVKLIKNEIEWYEEVRKQFVAISVPVVYPSMDKSELVMERVTGVPIYKIFSDVDAIDKELILNNVFINFKELHSVKKQVTNEQVILDIKKEAFDKLNTRYDEIERVINSFGKNISVVNGIEINNDPRFIIKKLFNAILDHYHGVEEYSLIHGDLQMSNSMVNQHSLKVTFIDPRGYFGDTKLYGLADYDIAKILYSLSGYENLNYSTSFYLKNIDEYGIEFDIPGIKFNAAEMQRFEPIHFLWLAVIWIGLAAYIKNDPVKSVAAHYHGMTLATRFLNGDYTI